MDLSLYPLLFAPVYKEHPWGGQCLAARYGRTGTPTICGESWEISAHVDGLSVVANGPLAGQTLNTLTEQLGAALTGTRATHPHRFPLLFKLIDARENLSVQVHPNDDNASLTGGEPKTEAWYVVDRTPGALLFGGFKPGTTSDTFRQAMAQGVAPQQLFHLDVEPGDALFIPGGLVHAIGAGALIYEVQQSSNTTYRLFDWGRLDAAGHPRPLHLDQAFQVINPGLPEPRIIRTPVSSADAHNPWQDVLSCRYFALRHLELHREACIQPGGLSFHALFILDGAVTLVAGKTVVPLSPGMSCLVPAGVPAFSLQPSSRTASLLVTTLPERHDPMVFS
ncbi:MAG: type I phosphomannose isomerase catalytic subunit [Kiritimatiellia bacterium]